MLVWRVRQVRTDVTHGKEAALVEVLVEFLDSYFKSIQQANKYSTEETERKNGEGVVDGTN